MSACPHGLPGYCCALCNKVRWGVPEAFTGRRPEDPYGAPTGNGAGTNACADAARDLGRGKFTSLRGQTTDYVAGAADFATPVRSAWRENSERRSQADADARVARHARYGR